MQSLDSDRLFVTASDSAFEVKFFVRHDERRLEQVLFD